MSANPTRADWAAATTAAPAVHSITPKAGVLRTWARRCGRATAFSNRLRGRKPCAPCCAFSDLHEQIRDRRIATGCASDRDLFETERFILDEVLQLICDRVQAVTQADGIVVALAEGPVLLCRAAAGPLAVERGIHLVGESEFLQDCVESGRILRSDDCEIDDRVELDLARQMGARSTVLVPLRGQREQLGVLQAFSTTAWAFTDHDIRCFDLFAELVLSALKPEDQDRRIHWLSDVADEVLQAKPAAAAPLAADAAIETLAMESSRTSGSVSDAGGACSVAGTGDGASPVSTPELAALEQPVVIPATVVEL